MMTAVGEIHRIIAGDSSDQFKVAIYLRQLRNCQRYYARYSVDKRHLANDQRYITESLKTDDLTVALQRAHERYATLKVQQDADVHLKALTVDEALDRFLDNYESNLKANVAGFTRHMLRGHRKSINIYWRDFVGNKPLNSINVKDLQRYEVWRRNWAKTTDRKKLHGNYKTTVANRTIVWELNSFKQFLRWCAEQSYYNGNALSFKAGKKLRERHRRSGFTREQYKKLYSHMNTHEYSHKGKYKNDWRLHRHRTMLRAYIIFMINTGLRIGEARHLKWSDISQQKNKLGRDVVIVRVSHLRSKVSRARTAVGQYVAYKALMDWREYREDVGDNCGDDEFIFCDPSGQPINDFREGFNAVIREADVEFDADGNKLTIYSLRHSYITFRLQFGRNLSIYSLAKNCGTSVQMIEQFYSDAVSEDFVDELTIGRSDKEASYRTGAAEKLSSRRSSARTVS